MKRPELRTVLYIIYYSGMIAGAAGMICLLFAFGHTDLLPIEMTFTMAGISLLGALTVGILQWVGMPPKKNAETPGKKARGHSGGK